MKAASVFLLVLNALVLGAAVLSSYKTQAHVAKMDSYMRSDDRLMADVNTLANRLVPAVEQRLSPLLEAPDGTETHAEALVDRLMPLISDYVSRSKEPSSEASDAEPVEYHTKADAVRLMEAARSKESPTALAECLATVDQWISKPEDEKDLQDYKLTLVTELQNAIVVAVKSLHKQCLGTETGTGAAKLYGEAGQLIALFPLSEDAAVVDQARSLTTSHSEIGVKIEVLRRQRYNSWAVERIAKHLTWLEKNSSSWSTKDNPKVVDQTASGLGPIDPYLLEPVVAQLYGMAISQANEAINTQQKTFLAEKMLDPRLAKRKNYGDF